MPVVRDERAIAAGASVTNILTGSKFEFLGRNSVVEIFSVMDGPAVGTVVMDVTFGNVLEGDGLQLPTMTATLGPNRNDHKLISALAQAGDRLQIKIANNGAAQANCRTLVVITAV